MPYKERDAFHRHQREWLNSLRPPGADDLENQNGIVAKATIPQYLGFVEEAGEILDYPNPRDVDLEQMKALESEMNGSESTINQKTTMVRAFLRWCGNAQACRWKISVHQSIYRGGIFLREGPVAKIRTHAKDLGLLTELIYSLGVDNGLRAVDMGRLTTENAFEFLTTGESEILGKGRNGGKVALQMLNRITKPLLEVWMKIRTSMVVQTGMDIPQLLCRVEHRKKGDKLVPLSYDVIRRTMVTLSDLSGIKFQVHDLRRTCGNRLWRRGWKIETIATILRHEDSGTTFRAYIGVDSDDMRSALDSLPGAAPAQPDGFGFEQEAKSTTDRIRELAEELLKLTGSPCPLPQSQA